MALLGRSEPFAPSTGEYIMLGKTFKGLTDVLLDWQTQEFLALETHRDRGTVYVRPELVVEFAFSDLRASIRYPGGLALRLVCTTEADTINADHPRSAAHESFTRRIGR
jgi:ATP-dependent DNA ligase